MLEEKPDEWHEASGVCISRSPSGRMKWPIAIKTMAIERIEAEATLVSVAREIGARESPREEVGTGPPEISDTAYGQAWYC